MARSDQSKRDAKAQASSSQRESNPELSFRKRNLTLDLHNAKKGRFDLMKDTAPVLSSPDIMKLKLKSPELESIILQQNALNSATPTPTIHAAQTLFPKVVTVAQEMYAQGFTEALNELHCGESSQGNFAIDVSSNSSSSMTYTDLDPSSRSAAQFMSPLDISIKEEPQTVPSMGDSPHISPIDMEGQEIIKLERKRQRNRVAASKCRRRKLERISRLEDKVKGLKGENSELQNFLMKIKEQVCVLKKQVLEHANSGCQLVSCYN